MNQALEQLAETISARFVEHVARVESRCGELTFEVLPGSILAVCKDLRDDAEWSFEQLIDLCGVDYSLYGLDEWNTETATFRGFSRGAMRVLPVGAGMQRRTGRGAWQGTMRHWWRGSDLRWSTTCSA